MFHVLYSCITRDLGFLSLNCIKYNVSKCLYSKFVNYNFYRSITSHTGTKCQFFTQNVVFLNRFRFFSSDSTKSDEKQLSSTSDSNEVEIPKESEPEIIFFDCHNLTIDQETAFEYSNRILSDPISDITVEESSKFLLPFPNCDLSPLVELITRPFRRNYLYEPACTMVQLCVERLENDQLTKVFEIGNGFNLRAYFLTLHVWILHRRAEKEIPEGVLLDRYLFSIYFELLRDWIGKRKVPEYRFNLEFKNTQAHMVRFIVELNRCTEDENLYPYKLLSTIKSLMYEDDTSDETVELLVKYIIRQFMHINNISRRHFLNTMFLWADVEPICKPTRLLKRPMYQLIKYEGYKGVELDKIEPNEKKKLIF